MNKMRRDHGPTPLLLFLVAVVFGCPSVASADLLEEAAHGATSGRPHVSDLKFALSQALTETSHRPQSNFTPVNGSPTQSILMASYASSLSGMDFPKLVSTYQTPLLPTTTAPNTQLSGALLLPGGGDVGGGPLSQAPAPGGLVLLLCGFPFL